tara:strand:- start:189 stop:377 length:189 start_codon:yes stop_codon:yes gene_type:complete
MNGLIKWSFSPYDLKLGKNLTIGFYLLVQIQMEQKHIVSKIWVNVLEKFQKVQKIYFIKEQK